MSLSILAGYTAACILLAITPGPNMALIVATTLGSGLRAGLVTLAGTLSGLTILVTIAAIGMSSVMVFMSEWFEVIRWVGAIYLIVLGVRQLHQYLRRRRGVEAPLATAVVPSPGTHYGHGLMVALSNPKVLLFLGAFFPQFVTPGSSAPLQLTVLAVIFVATLALVDLVYTFGVARARESLDPRRLKGLDLASGLLLVAGGLVLATARRP